MRYNDRRRRSSDKIYDILESKLPVRLSPALIIAVIGIMFVMFAMTCFSAVMFGSASDKLDTAKKNASASTEYYKAETTAADILSVLAEDDGSSLTDKNGELKYTGNEGSDKSPEITISRNGGNFSFDVPVSKTKESPCHRSGDRRQYKCC